MQFRQGEAKQVAPRANGPERRRPRNGRAGAYTTQRVTELIGMAKEVQVINTICRPVRNRQLSAVELAQEVDVMVIVGSRSSANTRELKHLCGTYNDRTIHVCASRYMAERIPGAKLVELQGIDHVPWGCDSEVIVGEIESWRVQKYILQPAPPRPSAGR